jgi:hypothetical protein
VTLALFTVIYLSLVSGLRDLTPIGSRIRTLFTRDREVDRLLQSVLILRSLQDRLESGIIPAAEEWDRAARIPPPWGPVFDRTLREARDRGAPIVPSLVRMQRLLEEQARWSTDAATKLAPAMGQAALSLLLVPLFALALWALLPGMNDHALAFGTAAAVSMLMGLGAFYWMTEMGEQARFGHLSASRRSWIASSVIALERLNALVMVGEPPDLAWNEVLAELHTREPELALAWGSLVWSDSETLSAQGVTGNPTESILVQLGREVRRLIQTSLIEGQAALERIESVQRSFLLDLRGRIDQDLARLGQRSLKPLFILVMPAIVFLMAAGMVLSAGELLG